MFIPESCDDDDGNDQHDGGEDQDDAEKGHHPRQSVHLHLNHVVQFGCSLHPRGGRWRLLLGGTHLSLI